jgi:hypothetical protein
MLKKNKVLTASDLGKLGNAARNRALSAKQRSAIASKAGKARWKHLTAKQRRELAARGGAASAGVSKRRRETK